MLALIRRTRREGWGSGEWKGNGKKRTRREDATQEFMTHTVEREAVHWEKLNVKNNGILA